ncbi:hypothetical protein AB4Y32_06110 [Paraburkholderia phymatum]|uniref:Uncharacterized protein n=1 Tax=Paraburkholderia phymatum TaxID=148447 RepID=A0ACC6TVL7_9BURK
MQRFDLNVMVNFLLDLISNLVILAVMLTVCSLFNGMRPGAKANGYLVFFVFIAIALAFDAALTFLVFADSQTRYGKFSTTESFMQRFAAYLTASGIAVCLARMRGRKASQGAQGSAVIQTSAYTKSQLPM